MGDPESRGCGATLVCRCGPQLYLRDTGVERDTCEASASTVEALTLYNLIRIRSPYSLFLCCVRIAAPAYVCASHVFQKEQRPPLPPTPHRCEHVHSNGRGLRDGVVQGGERGAVGQDRQAQGAETLQGLGGGLGPRVATVQGVQELGAYQSSDRVATHRGGYDENHATVWPHRGASTTEMDMPLQGRSSCPHCAPNHITPPQITDTTCATSGRMQHEGETY